MLSGRVPAGPGLERTEEGRLSSGECTRGVIDEPSIKQPSLPHLLLLSAMRSQPAPSENNCSVVKRKRAALWGSRFPWSSLETPHRIPRLFKIAALVACGAGAGLPRKPHKASPLWLKSAGQGREEEPGGSPACGPGFFFLLGLLVALFSRMAWLSKVGADCGVGNSSLSLSFVSGTNYMESRNQDSM